MRKDAELRKQRILEAACALVVYEGTNLKLDSVAEKAGVGIATLYRNYPTRNALILDCIHKLSEEMLGAIDQAKDEVKRGERDPELIFRELISHTIPAGINLLVPSLIEPDESFLSEELLEKKAVIVAALEEVLGIARNVGFIHETVQDNWVLNGLIQLYQAPAFNFIGDTPTARPDVEAMVTVFLEGCQRGLVETYEYRKNHAGS